MKVAKMVTLDSELILKVEQLGMKLSQLLNALLHERLDSAASIIEAKTAELGQLQQKLSDSKASQEAEAKRLKALQERQEEKDKAYIASFEAKYGVKLEKWEKERVLNNAARGYGEADTISYILSRRAEYEAIKNNKKPL